MSTELADAVFEAIGSITEPLFARIKALEAEVVAMKSAPPVPGPAGQDGRDGEKGADGKDAEPVDLEALAGLVSVTVEKHLRDNPPAAGRDGADGKDADPEMVKSLQTTIDSLQRAVDSLQETREKAASETASIAELVTASVEKAVAALPAPAVPDVTGLVSAEVTKAVANLPVPKDGVPGRDGVGVAGVLIDRDNALVVTLSNGTTQSLGVVVGKDGQKGADGLNGAPGRDGVGFEDIDESYEDDGRVLVRKFLKEGSVVREFRHVTKQPIYRGVYEPGRLYLAGDEVTWGGSVFEAKSDTDAKPGEIGEASRAWVLKVKRGAEGKKGKDGANGKDGRDGKDLRAPGDR